MRACIVGVCDQRHMTLISLYTDILDRVGIEYDLICIDKYKSRNLGYNKCKIYAYPFTNYSKFSSINRLRNFLGFSIFASRILLKEKYGFVIVWNENTIVLLMMVLLLRYRDRYCVNIRDFNFKLPMILNPIRKIVVRHAAFTTVPTPSGVGTLDKYRGELPVISMNDRVIATSKIHNVDVEHERAIRISFIGAIRTIHEDRFLMRAFGNDSRFVLQFFGSNSEVHRDFIESEGIRNVVLEGEFDPSETFRFLDRTDVLDVYYSGKDWVNCFPIKFQYGPALRIPCIVASGSIMGSIGTKLGFAYEIDEDNVAELPDSLYNWYRSIDACKFEMGCNEYCNWVKNINEDFRQKFLSVLSE